MANRMSLTAVLDDPKRAAAYLEFLKREYADENLEFYMQVEKFKSVPEQEAVAERQRIYDTYISSDGARQINISHAAAEAIRTSLSSEELERDCFNPAQLEVVECLRAGSFSRYLETVWYSYVSESPDYRNDFLSPMLEAGFVELCKNDPAKWKEKGSGAPGKLQCWKTRNGSDDVLMIKCRHVMEASAELILDTVWQPEARLKFDENMVRFEVLERIDHAFKVARLQYKAPLVKDRDAVVGMMRRRTPETSLCIVRSVPWSTDEPHHKGIVRLEIECSGFLIVPIAPNKSIVTYVVQFHLGAVIPKPVRNKIIQMRYRILENLKAYVEKK